MMDFMTTASLVCIVFSFIVLVLFIWKLKLNLLFETTDLRYRGNNQMVSLSTRKIPFEISIPGDNTAALLNEENTFNLINLSYKSSSTFSLSFNVCVAINELKKSISNNVHNGRRLFETINLISLWGSQPETIIVTNENETKVHQCDFSAIPSHSKEQLIKLIKEADKKKLLSPLSVYLELDSIDGLVDNDIVSMLAVFSASITGRFEVEEYYIETLNGNIYPIKKLFNSGVHQDDLSSGNSSNESNQLCVVCHNYPVTRVSLPCRHASVCKLCYNKLDDYCPICRKKITSFFQIMDESFLPESEEELRDNVSTDIRNMGWWQFIKSIWNAS